MAVELAEDDDPLSDRCWEHVPYHPYLRPGPKAAARVSVVPPSTSPVRILGYVGGNRRTPPVHIWAFLADHSSPEGDMGYDNLNKESTRDPKSVSSEVNSANEPLHASQTAEQVEPVVPISGTASSSGFLSPLKIGQGKQNCSNDASVKVWDFARCQEERALFDDN